ncbi:hypothetical protein LEP1GSC047_0042 [Leptospira inadai serovar Lyme str. 10]|uniref:Uncharacterized protein n=1 Tax=Leptospira inadai serovar Lyme str. 10 TaxID=1049790 RepID=V6HDI0_9LEPT|nr:hypothetical protein LEP1GSC047_0042 [Leptospira inadai serovar Lyme str. 10]
MSQGVFRGQRTEDRGQRTEDRGQRTEDRGQRTENYSYYPENNFFKNELCWSSYVLEKDSCVIVDLSSASITFPTSSAASV